MTAAVAIWVKTPGLSPVKTRLARAVGTGAAEEFYRLSVAAVAAVVRAAVERSPVPLAPFWAVAEPESTGWQEFEVVRQEGDGLGERLSQLYDRLLERHQPVAFVGADSPQLTPELLLRALERAAGGGFVLGPAEDGGFYLFAGSRPVPRAAWTGVEYSASDTLARLVANLEPLAPVQRLETLLDVDTADELPRLREELQGRGDLLPEQRAVLRWLTLRDPTARAG